MFFSVFAVHDGLGASRRLPGLTPADARISAAELGVLFLLGVSAALVAAASACLKLRLGIPGHNIIRVIFPMALGLALVPRRGAGTMMGASALATAAVLGLAGAGGLGAGAFTSLALPGVLLDLALLGARPGWPIYARLAAAGLAANLAAFAVRGGVKLLGDGGLIDGRPLAAWWPKAAVTYPIAGLLAGLLSAAVWFRATERAGPAGRREAGP